MFKLFTGGADGKTGFPGYHHVMTAAGARTTCRDDGDLL